jgi:hypothetical protein
MGSSHLNIGGGGQDVDFPNSVNGSQLLLYCIHNQRNEVLDVVIGCASWVDVNFNNQLEAFCKWDRVIYILGGGARC